MTAKQFIELFDNDKNSTNVRLWNKTNNCWVRYDTMTKTRDGWVLISDAGLTSTNIENVSLDKPKTIWDVLWENDLSLPTDSYYSIPRGVLGRFEQKLKSILVED